MDKKLVYILVSRPEDHYTEMAILSTQCAKKYSPGIDIELVVDSAINESLTGYRGTIRNYVDKIRCNRYYSKEQCFH